MPPDTAPVSALDLTEWVFTLTDSEYQAPQDDAQSFLID
jgi:hypothetical protein